MYVFHTLYLYTRKRKKNYRYAGTLYRYRYKLIFIDGEVIGLVYNISHIE